jgi:cupin 2 domain-containing protein
VNLFSPLPDASRAEMIETVLARPAVRIERIVSLGQTSPPGF